MPTQQKPCAKRGKLGEMIDARYLKLEEHMIRQFIAVHLIMKIFCTYFYGAIHWILKIFCTHFYGAIHLILKIFCNIFCVK